MLHKLMRICEWLIKTTEGNIFGIIMLFAFIIRLPLLTFSGYYADLQFYAIWGENLGTHFFTFYRDVGYPLPSPNYPLGSLYLFTIMSAIYHILMPIFQLPPYLTAINSNGFAPALTKVPVLIADMTTITFLYYQAHKYILPQYAYMIMLGYAISPVVLHDGIWWGQTDILPLIALLIACFAVVDGQVIMAAIACGIAPTLKPQAIFILPLIVVYVFRWQGWRESGKFLMITATTAFIIMLPAIFPNYQLGEFYHNMQNSSFSPDLPINASAYNFWWLLDGIRTLTLDPSIPYHEYRTIGQFFFLIIMGTVFWMIWMRREHFYLLMGAAIVTLAMFTFGPSQHERYAFGFLIFFLAGLIFVRGRSVWGLSILYVIMTFIILCNFVFPFTVVNYVVDYRAAIFPYFSDTTAFSLWLGPRYDIASKWAAAAHVIGFFCIYLFYFFGQPSIISQKRSQVNPTISQDTNPVLVTVQETAKENP
jgi:Gpi18-like mannosyltransferase